MFFEIGVHKVCNIHRKTPVLEAPLFLIKLKVIEASNLTKKGLQDICFPVIIAKFLRKFYLKNTTGGCFYTLNSSGI